MIVIRSIWASAPVRFLFCGGFAAFVNWAARFPLSHIMPFPLAVFLALAIGMTVGFVLYRTLVWPRSPRPLLTDIATFIAVNSVNAVGILVFSMVLLAVFEQWGVRQALGEAIAHALGIAAGAVANYFGHSRITFGRGRSIKPYA